MKSRRKLGLLFVLAFGRTSNEHEERRPRCALPLHLAEEPLAWADSPSAQHFWGLCPCAGGDEPTLRVPEGPQQLPRVPPPTPYSQVGQDAALVSEQAAVPKPDEENQVRPPRLRFGSGREGAALQRCGPGGGHCPDCAGRAAVGPGAALTRPPGSARTAPASPPEPAAAPPPATPTPPVRAGRVGARAAAPGPAGPAHPEGRKVPAGGAVQLPHQPRRPLSRHAAAPRARETRPLRSQWGPRAGP